MKIDEFLARDRCDVLCNVILKNGERFLFHVDGWACAEGTRYLTGVRTTPLGRRRQSTETTHVPCDDVAEIYIWPKAFLTA